MKRIDSAPPTLARTSRALTARARYVCCSFGHLALLLLLPSTTWGNLCFPPPTFVPGLYGPPAWTGSGTLRTDLNEPRWAASPLTDFASDLSAAEGKFRLMTNAAGDRLYVSMQTGSEAGSVSSQDRVFLGISKDSGGANNTAQAVVIRVKSGSPAGGFVAPDQFTSYSYDVGSTPQWSSSSTLPTWVEDPAVWSNSPGGDVDWGINFVVKLDELGISNTDTFKLALGMVIRDELNITNTYPRTPIESLSSEPVLLFDGNLFEDPSTWAQSAATGDGCLNGITLSTAGIYTNNPTTTKIATDIGHINELNAMPDYGSVGLVDDMLLAEFRVANWGSIADPDAGWEPVPGATAESNSPGGLINFECPANTASETCGMPTPSTTHQCVQVRLNHAAGYNHTNAPIQTASAYRNMNFLPLSKDERVAELSLEGLPKTDSGTRDVYLYVYPRNLPEHGDKQIYLATEAMAATQREYLARTEPEEVAQSPAEATRLAHKKRREQVAEARRREKEREARENNDQKEPGNKELPSLVTKEQALKQVWPNYEVRPYYDSGTISKEDDKSYKVLVPMPSFLMYFSHEGPLFGFSHQLEGVDGGEFSEVRAPSAENPGVYKLAMKDTGVAHVKTLVEAHEKPKDAGGADGSGKECPECSGACPAGQVCKEPGPCGCRFPGSGGGGSSWLLLVSVVLGAGAWCRRRALSA